MNNYTESKKQLDKIRQEYGCKGEIIFRTAIQYVLDYGKKLLTDEKWCAGQFMNIDTKHNKAEAEDKTLWMTRDFEKALLECAIKIAQIPTVDIVMYLQHEWLFYDDCGEISYDRAIQMVQNCLEWITESISVEDTLSDAYAIGFSDEEIDSLGYGYLLKDKEGDEE